MALFDEEEWRNVLETVDDKTARPDFGTTDDQRLGRLTIACLIINRTVGSGIFVSPAKVLRATGSMGASLCLWVFGGLFALSGVLVWLEFGLTIPRHTINGTERSVPRSGGEKNYVSQHLPAKIDWSDSATARIRLHKAQISHHLHVRHCLHSSG